MLVGPQGRHHAALPGPEADPRRSTQLGIGRSVTVSLAMTSLNYFPLSHSGALVGVELQVGKASKTPKLE